MLPTTMSAAIQIPKIKILLRPAIVIEVSIVGNLLLCQICLLKICIPSTALLHKNKCSTYNKYVSALFLFAPCIRYHYFQKAYGKGYLLHRLFSKALEIGAFQNGQGCPWFFAVARFGLCTNLVVEQCTRRYTVQQAIFKRLTEKSFSQVPALQNRSRSKYI